MPRRRLRRTPRPQSLESFQAAIALAPTRPIFYLEGAALLQANGDGEGALALLNAYEARFKDVTLSAADGSVVNALERDDRYWIAVGNVLRHQGKLDEAMGCVTTRRSPRTA